MTYPYYRAVPTERNAETDGKTVDFEYTFYNWDGVLDTEEVEISLNDMKLAVAVSEAHRSAHVRFEITQDEEMAEREYQRMLREMCRLLHIDVPVTSC